MYNVSNTFTTAECKDVVFGTCGTAVFVHVHPVYHCKFRFVKHSSTVTGAFPVLSENVSTIAWSLRKDYLMNFDELAITLVSIAGL